MKYFFGDKFSDMTKDEIDFINVHITIKQSNIMTLQHIHILYIRDKFLIHKCAYATTTSVNKCRLLKKKIAKSLHVFLVSACPGLKHLLP